MGLANFIFSLINSVLNLVGLLLWLNWVSARTETFLKSQPASLIGTLKKAGASPAQRWKFLAGLSALIVLRALIYWQMGSAANWTPRLHLVAISLPFRSQFLGQMLLFSAFSFLQTLAIFYFSLLLLSALNWRLSDADPLQKLVRLHLGWFEKWPRTLKWLLPLSAMGLSWVLLHPLLVRLGMVTQSQSGSHVLLQALLIGIGAYHAWKYVAVAFLFLYLLNSYVYLGNHPAWVYVNATSRRLLAPIRWLPLRFTQMDFAPVVGIGLVFLLAEIASRLLKNIFPV